MGWHDGHLHRFRTGVVTTAGRRYLEEVSEGAERTAWLDQIAPNAKDRVRYDDDFGDGWEHDILVEAVLPLAPDARYPNCLAGKRACPPEDCGGVWGYAELLDAIADPRHPEHDEPREWLGRPFDPEAFNLDEVNQRLA